MSLRIIARRAASIRSFPTSSLASSSSSLPSLARFKSSSDDVPQTPRDPYPLPLSHPVSQDPLDSTMAELTSFEIPPLDRSHEDIETTRKRLVYQARKRGMLEGDLLLATFAREKLALMKPDEVTEFDKVSPTSFSISNPRSAGAGSYWVGPDLEPSGREGREEVGELKLKLTRPPSPSPICPCSNV